MTGIRSNVEIFRDQDEAYLDWVKANPNCFVASYESPRGAYHRLHHAGCGTLTHLPVGSESWTREYFKYCGSTIVAIDIAAAAAGLPPAKECGTCKPRTGPDASVAAKRNPPWRREELILALHHYFTEARYEHGKGSPKLQALSQLLNRLPYRSERGATFRNPSSCEMKLSNFRALDPSEAGIGLTSVSKADRKIWTEFANDHAALTREAQRIRTEGISLPVPAEEPEQDEEAYPEGALYYRMHRARERDQGLVRDAKRRFASRNDGRLFCEVCGFDFAAIYGPRGEGFIEAHHTKPVAAMLPGERTKAADLAMVCANCHRMLHVGNGLSIHGLQDELNARRTTQVTAKWT